MDEFLYTTYSRQVIFGAGSLARLGDEIERFGWHRILLCSTGSQRRSGHIARLENALGARLATTYEKVQPHVPEQQLSEVMELAWSCAVDAIIALGGGSPIGMAKAVAFELADRQGNAAHRTPSPLDSPLVPVVAIPTTYAGSEMTPVYGVTRHEDGVHRKVTVTDPRIAPRLVLYDPLLTLDLSPEMTASTGINALAHCMEALYSVTRNPLSTAAALGGIRSISSSIVRCYKDGGDLEARTKMLSGAFLAGTALAHVEMALHHGLCHVLGGTAGVAHGVANAIILPHALRFNVEATAPQLAQASQGMDQGRRTRDQTRSAMDDAVEVITAIEMLIERLHLPGRLRDVGIGQADLPRLAELAFESKAVRNNPRPIAGAEQIQGILEAAW